jgi:hypothetical protein
MHAGCDAGCHLTAIGWGRPHHGRTPTNKEIILQVSKLIAAAALGAACAMPVMAQGTSSTSQAAKPAQTSQAAQSGSDTKSMGAGPSGMDRPVETRDKPDLGWLGLLGLAGLLGLRRNKHDDHRDTRHTTAAR